MRRYLQAVGNTNQVSTVALIVIAAAGGLGAIISGLVAAWVSVRNERHQAQREHVNWIKEKKYAEYTKLVASMRYLDAIKSLGRGAQNDDVRHILEYNASLNASYLLVDRSRYPRFSELISAFGSMNKDDYDVAAAHEVLLGVRSLLREDLAETGVKAKKKLGAD
ncbi:hypothetical protein [Nocardioides nematodiphilus]|uniref:hypothetical protein n=1 Tax=Nocardioides nematodiphilus TaxID=2849669 RepID=UPI001CDA1D98|nr:hypothetical protein [Nocardioides nematodiphilus]MCA1984802.1 hypothetical protein [Nocardioides nematodiphilus]